jgi:predicted GIY-YIG superfamily endonuclease
MTIFPVIASRESGVAIQCRLNVRSCSRWPIVKRPAVYIMANRKNGTLYTGVTSDLVRRVAQHRQGSISGFARRYGCRLLVYFEMHDDMVAAIVREKQIKAGSRGDKLELIERMNPAWDDLYQLVV